MNRHILVPLDGRDLSFHALPLVKALARPGDRIELVTAFEPVPPFPLPEYREAATRWAQARQAEATEWLGDCDAEVDTTILFRAPSVALRDYAEEVSPDLVVMATHGRGPISRAWIGSITDGILRSGVAPTVAVRPSGEVIPETGVAATVGKVLVALDGSTDAERALQTVLEELGPETLIHAVRVVDLGRGLPSPYLPQEAQEGRSAIADAEAYMEGVRVREEANGTAISVAVLKGQRPSEAILRAATGEGCDLIAMGSRGVGRVKRFALGSVLDKVIRSSELPVLVVPPAGD